MQNLIPNLGVFVTDHLEESLPELGNVALHAAWAHLLSCLESDLGVGALCQFDDLKHVFGLPNAVQVVNSHRLGIDEVRLLSVNTFLLLIIIPVIGHKLLFFEFVFKIFDVRSFIENFFTCSCLFSHFPQGFLLSMPFLRFG